MRNRRPPVTAALSHAREAKRTAPRIHFLVQPDGFPLYRIPKRPGGERGDFNRVVMLDTLLSPHLQAKARIVAGFRNPSVKREELLSAHQNLLLVEQPHRQTSLPQHRLRRKAQFLELSWQRGRDSKSIRHRSPNSINLHPYSALNRSWYCSSLTFSIQSTTLPSFFS